MQSGRTKLHAEDRTGSGSSVYEKRPKTACAIFRAFSALGHIGTAGLFSRNKQYTQGAGAAVA